MNIVDRQFQTEAVESIWRYFRTKSGNPILALPTGSGKSVVIARFLQSVFAIYPHQKVLILTHRKELIQQNYEKLLTVWPFAPAGIYSDGLGQKVYNRAITFAGVASVYRRPEIFGHVDLVIIDEAHLVSPHDNTMYQTFLKALYEVNPYLKIIGLTATPWRLGHGLLTDPIVRSNGTEEPSIFSDFCFDITSIQAFNRLIREGFLVPLVPKRTDTLLSVDGVHMRGGEFIEKELQTAVDKEEVTYAALKEALELGAKRRKWLIFATGIEHADHITDMLHMLGVSAGVVHSRSEDRDGTIAAFKAGQFRAIVNANVLTTGYDNPEIDMIICLRPTASTVLWVQMMGRGTRPVFAPGYDVTIEHERLAAIAAGPKQNCLVLDYAGNTKRLGPINDPVIPRRKGQGGGMAPVKCCDVCHTWVHASLRFCDGLRSDGSVCGHEFKFETKLNLSAGTDELIKGDMPIVEVIKVDHITIGEHKKLGRPNMVKLTYYCGLNRYNEFVCPEHNNLARRHAVRWWRERSKDPLPATTPELLEVIDQVPHATHLRVWINKEFPEILAHCFDGSAFGTEEPTDRVPEIQKLGKNETSGATQLDADIPF